MSLPEPKGRQREVMYLPERGHTVVLGTAGSGKTTMAILRAHYLATLTKQKVLVVTFTKTLVTYLKALIAKQEVSHLVRVENYHLFARGYLGHRGRMGYNDIADTDTRQRLIKQSLSDLHNELIGSKLQSMPVQFFVEESKWIAGCNIQSSAEYTNGTYHAAKGLEFDVVLLPYCETALIPDPERLCAFSDPEEAMAQEARLLYVAVTRARVRLILTYTNEQTTLLPDDQTLYNRVNV